MNVMHKAPWREPLADPSSPLREALAKAIEQRTEAERASRAAAAAADDARGAYLDATGVRRATEAALAEAREGRDRLEILNAIEREAEASAAVERLRADRERAEAELERPAEALRLAQARVEAAASAVMRCELERLVRASAEATERAVAALSQLISCAEGAARGSLSFDPSAPGLLASNEIAAARQGFFARAQRHTAGAAFRLWRAALETDAYAPLPPVAP